MRRPALGAVLGAALVLAPSGEAGAGTGALELVPQRVALGGKERRVLLPRGLVLEVLTSDLEQPRMLVFAANGDLLIGSRSTRVYRLEPPYTRSQVLVELDQPHGVALREGELLIGRTDGVYRAPYEPGQARIPKGDVTLLARLPSQGPHHLTRTVAVGPDGRVYVSLGTTGNCGDNYLDDSYPFEARRGGLMVLREDGGTPAWDVYAAGLRNPVGFDWQPGTGVIHASNNGPDHWGYDLPPEYFARVTPGSFHGMPWFQFDGERLRRDSCIETPPPRPLAEVSRPVATFQAHQAPIGVAFVPDGSLDPALRGDALVALHGSWVTGDAPGGPAGRRKPKLVAVRFEDGQAKRVDDLVTGFQLENGKRWVRPVGLAFGPDGALYFTSDRNPGSLLRLRRAD